LGFAITKEYNHQLPFIEHPQKPESQEKPPPGIGTKLDTNLIGASSFAGSFTLADNN